MNKESSSRKTIKCKLKDILHSDRTYTKIYDCVKRANVCEFVNYSFVNAYVIYCFKNNLEIPKLDYDFLRMCFKALSSASAGPKPKGEQLIIYNKLCTFFDNVFSNSLPKKIKKNKFNNTNLSTIFNYSCTEMATVYKNHIVLNFFKYVHQCVNQIFIERKVKYLTKNEISKLTLNEKTTYFKERHDESVRINNLRKELLKVKNDLCDKNTNLTSEPKYHEWIKTHKLIFFPETENKLTYEQDIQINYHKYVKHLLNMNLLLESQNKKIFSALPTRTHLYDMYVHLDTAFLKDIYGLISQKKEQTNNEIWSGYMKINKKKFKLKNYSFNHMISTDGTSVSISFIRNDEIESKNKMIRAKANASKKTKAERKNMSQAEIDVLNENKKKDARKKQIEQTQRNAIFRKEQKEKFKTLPKEEQEKIILETKLKKHKFEYIEDAVKDPKIKAHLKTAYENGKLIVGDPGKKSPLALFGKLNLKIKVRKCQIGKMRKIQIGKNKKEMGIFFNYTSGQRINGLKRLIITKRIDIKKKKTIIEKIQKNKEEKTITLKEKEQELTEYTSKTTDLEKFMLGFKKRFELREKIIEEEKYNEFVKKMRWYGYINKRRHEDKLLDEIENVYGKEAIFIIGDWSAKDRIKRLGMPNMGLKKLLSKRFQVYLIDEYNTSKLGWISEKEGEHMKVDIKFEKEGKAYKFQKELHSVLRFKIGKKENECVNKETGCINRDYNAVRNMRKIVEELVKTGKRPIIFQRKKTTASEKKESDLGGRVVRQTEKCVAYGESQQKSKDTKNNKNNIKPRKVVKNIEKVVKKSI
jgi:hypothetical protein